MLRTAKVTLDARVALRWPHKKPSESLDFEIDWTARLDDGDAIERSTFFLPAGISATSTSKEGALTRVWISGGTDGTAYEIRNEIVTVKRREMDQIVRLKIKSK